ncbi:MAG: DNA topoisomerase I [Armatimonadetes bacterium 55-13]|nr:type I DNA topoisomerase [Armatimonadota bacterium]ODU53911.1 MAG: DNA topoisomerase I [bacterium SCN 57-13]OJU61482.1 MAG: DNA topoisomerase I [Armatimonadetes bacterium 55-13]
MAKKLVIVESPAKAKTIGSYLGNDYEVLASVGHIRDLHPNARGLDPELKKKWWADYSVDVDNDFEPIYEVPPEKAQQVSRLRQALKGKEELILATDEDREGESISWHLLQTLKPAKSVQVKRIAFHEITKDAILSALATPRTIDEGLVEAQEARRILDRLYGYTLSPVLWSRVMKNLSAGRVQSPAVKLIVEREKLRRDFRSASYWDLKARLSQDGIEFDAELRSIDGKRVANGSDFDDSTGQLKEKKGESVMLLNEEQASSLAEKLKTAKPWQVSKLSETEGQERPYAPFMTTTLQQDANRKFGFSADRTMRIAQTLYEGVEIGGEQIGLITYMRTDSLTLSSAALENLRGLIQNDYSDCLPAKPNVYTSKVRNAQEAHEAIRPTDAFRKPSEIRKALTEDQFKIYDLIWKRTVACQMKNAQVLRTEAEIAVENTIFRAAGKQILFDGYRRVYLEGLDDEDAEKEAGERRLPRMKEGDQVQLVNLGAAGHETKPPARFTDATLIKELEKQGIGRPSTYASIISVIVDRGYVRKAGKQLIPTFKAFLTIEVLESGFSEFMELDFTRNMDDALDEIAEGKVSAKGYLKEFFLGEPDRPGLKVIVDERKRQIPYPLYLVGTHPETNEPIYVRNGKDGDAFLQMGDGETKKYANVPEDLAPADLTIEKAVELYNQKSPEAESIGIDPRSGRRLLLKQRGSYYLEVERTPEEIEAKVKPTWVSLPLNADPRALSQEDLNDLCQLPRQIGKHPETGENIEFKLGKYGPYIQSGAEIRNVEDWRTGLKMSVEEAVEVLKQPKFQRQARQAAAPIQEFGELPDAAGPVKVMSGRFGPYVTDGETNATLPKDLDPATLTKEQAIELLAKKRAAGPSTRKKVTRKKTATKAKAKPKSKK